MENNSEKLFKVLGILTTVIGMGVTLVSDWLAEKRMEEKIEEKVEEALAKREKEEEENNEEA